MTRSVRLIATNAPPNEQRTMNVLLALITDLIVLLGFATDLGDEGLPRVQIIENTFGRVVADYRGEPLRGASVALFKFQSETIGLPGYPKTNHATDPAFWDRMKSAGVTAVRVVSFDPFQRSHGDAADAPNRPYPFACLGTEDAFLQGASTTRQAWDMVSADQQRLLNEMDAVVNLAAERQMYVIINYHDTGGYRDADFAKGLEPGQDQFDYTNRTVYLIRFWRLIAPRYAQRTNVLYELTNEPVPWHPNDYTLRDVSKFANIYDRVRGDAPDTHIILASFATPDSWTSRSMKSVAEDLVDYGVDFSNASIGFHTYDLGSSGGLPRSVEPIKDLMASFPVINTEAGYPEDVPRDEGEPASPGYFGHRYVTQSMEQLGISWVAWNTFGDELFEQRFEKGILVDATDKGYRWSGELNVLSRIETVVDQLIVELRRRFPAMQINPV